MVKRDIEIKDLYIGMRVTAGQLRHIMNKYMILVYDNPGDSEGTLVFIGDKQTKEYDQWFMQEKPITPIFNIEMDPNVICEDMEDIPNE